MNEPHQVAEAFLRAWTSGDMPAARALCADDMHFVGPIEEWHDPDDHLRGLAPVADVLDRLDVHLIVAAGDDVVIVYDLVTTTPVGTARIAEWSTVRDGKISAIRAHFDSHPWRSAGFGGEGA